MGKKKKGMGHRIVPVQIAAAEGTLYAMEKDGTVWQCFPGSDYYSPERHGWERVCLFVDGEQDAD